jgi:hypothetical protein
MEIGKSQRLASYIPESERNVLLRNRMLETGASGSVGAPLDNLKALPGNGVLPTRSVGPFYLNRLEFALRYTFCEKVAKTFS